MQKPLAAGQGKTVTGAVLLVAVGRSVPGGPPRPLAGEIPEADGGGRVAPDPEQRSNVLSISEVVKYCTYIAVGGVTVGKQRHICELTHTHAQ